MLERMIFVDNNLNASKLKRLFKNKNFVTGLCVLLVAVVLIV